MKLIKALVLFISLSATFFSCYDWKRGKFEITNNTPFTIDSMFIEPNSSVAGKYVSIKPMETISYFTNMHDEHNDGVHKLGYKIGDKRLGRGLTYYSNGNFIEDMIKLEIYTDTIIIKPVYNNK